KYISSHSTMLAYVSCAISAKMDWSSDTTYQKLSMAALLHDITLENDELASIQTLQELKDQADRFTEEEVRAYRFHPMSAAELCHKLPAVPSDVDVIIGQHHERPDGSGFPRKLGHSYIAPLSCIFIVAHEIVRTAFQKGSKFDIEEVIAKNEELYSVGNFK